MRRFITSSPRVAMACVVSLALLLVGCGGGSNSGGCPKSSREKPLSNLDPISCKNWELKISTAKLVPNDVILQANTFNDVSDLKSWIVVEAKLRYDGSETGRVSDAISSSSFLVGSKNITYTANDQTPTFTNLKDEFAPIPYDASNPYSGGTVSISMWFWVDNDDTDFVLGLFVGDGDAEEPNVWIDVSTSDASTTPTDLETEGAYEVGEIGPGCGTIFFVDYDNQYAEFDYLEAAPTDLGGYSWGDALNAAIAYRGGGLADWRIPTKDELDLLYLDKALVVGGFSANNYWSSSEKDVDYAWSQYFIDGEQSAGYPKYTPFEVRPVRSFDGSSSMSTSQCSMSTSPTSVSACPTSVSASPTDGGAEVAYKVGDTGPGGGIIVYVDKAGFNNCDGDDKSIGAMCLTGTCHYLEMAPTDLEEKYFWEEAILKAEAFSTPSADDWVLPSKDALNEICKFAFGDTVYINCNDTMKGGLSLTFGGFSADLYWSSSEVDATVVWFMNFENGNPSNYLKNYQALCVRPVRAF